MTCSCRLVDRSDDVVRRLDFERNASCPVHGDAAMRRANEAEITRLRAELDAAEGRRPLPDVVRQAIAELDAEHQPQWASPEAKAAGKDPIGCDLCWPADGSWPCATRLIVDDLRAAVDAPCPTCENTGLHPAGDPDGLGCWDCGRRPVAKGRRG